MTSRLPFWFCSRSFARMSPHVCSKSPPIKETKQKRKEKETHDINTETGRTFEQMGVTFDRVQLLAKNNISTMFPIQEKTYRAIRDGHDVVGRAKTGTGKTLAYLLPLLERYESRTKGGPNTPFMMVLTPTRELALQVNKEIGRISSKLNAISIYGGHPVTAQAKNLSKHVDIVVGTPGRILHFLQNDMIIPTKMEAFVLDEADQMLDTGFKKDIELILSMIPRGKQTLLFSATLPMWVKEVSKKYFKDPEIVDLVGTVSRLTPGQVSHQYIPISLSLQRIIVLSRLIARYRNEKMLVFVNTKSDCAQLAASPLISFGGRVRALHGDIKQEERKSVLEGFRDGTHNVVIATDVAARGLDISNIDIVVHYHVPQSTDSYIHRSGRCGRAGKFGTVLSISSGKDKFLLAQIQKRIGFEFSAINLPTDEDIAKTSSEGIVASLERIDGITAKNYLPLAEKLLKEYGAEAFAKTLSMVAGHKSQAFSLLNGTEGFTTLRIRSSKEPITKVSAVAFLHKLGGNGFGLAQVCPDGSVVIDCESTQVSEILLALPKLKNKSPIEITIENDIPEVSPSDQVLSFRQGAIAMDEKYAPIICRSPLSMNADKSPKE